jgi:hypothetical protein
MKKSNFLFLPRPFLRRPSEPVLILRCLLLLNGYKFPRFGPQNRHARHRPIPSLLRSLIVHFSLPHPTLYLYLKWYRTRTKITRLRFRDLDNRPLPVNPFKLSGL